MIFINNKIFITTFYSNLSIWHKNIKGIILFFILIPLYLFPQTEEQSNIQEKKYSENLTGDWGNLRNSLSENGFDFEFVYKGEYFSNLSGGIKKGSTYLDNIDLIMSVNLENIGLSETGLTLHILGNNGGAPNDYAGTIQGISNIETIPTWKVYQLFLEKKLFDSKLSVLFGLYDLNSEFDISEHFGLFIHPSYGIGPDFSQSGINGPSIFPTTSLALRLKYDTDDHKYFQIGIFDGVPGDPDNPKGTHIKLSKDDGLLIAGEFGLTLFDKDVIDFKFGIGSWLYTSKTTTNELTATNSCGNYSEHNFGFYVLTNKFISNNLFGNNENLFGFLRFGYAYNKINPIGCYIAGGVTIDGLFLQDDALGFGMTMAHLSVYYINFMDMIESTKITKCETNFELTYSFFATDWLKIQPAFQYVCNPTYCNMSNNGILFFTRFMVNL